MPLLDLKSTESFFKGKVNHFIDLSVVGCCQLRFNKFLVPIKANLLSNLIIIEIYTVTFVTWLHFEILFKQLQAINFDHFQLFHWNGLNNIKQIFIFLFYKKGSRSNSYIHWVVAVSCPSYPYAARLASYHIFQIYLNKLPKMSWLVSRILGKSSKIQNQLYG